MDVSYDAVVFRLMYSKSLQMFIFSILKLTGSLPKFTIYYSTQMSSSVSFAFTDLSRIQYTVK